MEANGVMTGMLNRSEWCHDGKDIVEVNDAKWNCVEGNDIVEVNGVEENDAMTGMRNGSE